MRASLLLVLVIGQLLCHFVCDLIHYPDSLRVCPSLLVVLMIGQLLCLLCASLSVIQIFLCVRLSITLCPSPCTYKCPALPRNHEVKFIATPRLEQ